KNTLCGSRSKTVGREWRRPSGCSSHSRLAPTDRDSGFISRAPLCEATGEICGSIRRPAAGVLSSSCRRPEELFLETIGSEKAVASIHVLLVDDHAMFRESLARLLEKEPGISVVGQSASCADALTKLAKSGANIVLLDVDLGPERPLDFILEAKKRGYSGQILVVTAGVSGPEAVQLVQAGVAGILHKHHSTDALLETIRKVASGEVCLEQDYLAALFRSVDRTRESTRPQLTERDKKVLRFVFQGLTNKEIGSRIEISEGAVKFSLRQLCEKLGVRTRAQLVKVALEQYRDQL